MEFPNEIDHKSYDKIDLEVYLSLCRPGKNLLIKLSTIKDLSPRRRKNWESSSLQQKL